ncbi:Importin beta-like protein [Cladobotryum mycophilum]|uniref:Importin beta-like protein n=1 Tax=Cladobotryum mycophilum TaxID=491253 RepID=A0ABR0S995_9HYPO
MMEDETLPSDLDQVESLILALYEPNPPEVISRTQAILSRLQSSSQAWSLAHHLLERPNEKIKFFGALTIIVKLNTESSSLSDADAVELLVSLIRWYLSALRQQSGQLVLRKISSALATFFLYFHRLWAKYIRHLVICLASHQSWHPDTIDDTIDYNATLSTLAPAQLQAALWVVSSVVEDVTRFDLNAVNKSVGLYHAVIKNASEAVSLMIRCMTQEPTSLVAKEDSIKCLQSWVWFAQRISPRDSTIANHLRPLFGTVIDSVVTEELYDVSVELLTEALFTYPPLLVEQHYTLLGGLFKTEWFQDRYEQLILGDFDFNSVRLGQLLLAFGETRIEALIENTDGQGQGLLSSLCGLLAADGYPVAEDKIFVPAVEFWSTFAETIADYMSSDDDATSTRARSAIPIMMQAVSNAWQKSVYPPSDTFCDWDSNDRVGFNDARKDVVDFLQSVYVLVGPQLVATFSTLTLSALSASSWLQLEAAAFCLGGLADCSKEDARCDDALAAVFSSPLFTVLRASQTDVPTRTRQTFLALIEQYREYFERNANLLPAALNLLFSEVSVHSMAISASKSIYRLCSSCRSHLHPEVDGFLDEYQSLVSRQQLDCISMEKILGALASIAQAIPEDNRRYAACAKILGFIENDVQKSLELLGLTDSGVSPHEIGMPCPDISPDELPGLHIGLRALRCMASAGRGFQAPSESSIDLESGSQPESNQNPELIQLQRRVIGMIVEIQEKFSRSTEVTELICSVLRSGFSETAPGPFVFSAEDIASFLIRHTNATPRVGVIVSTACSFISSLHPQLHPYSQEILYNVVLWVIGLLKQLPEPEAEPELAQNSIEFVSRLLNKSPETFIRLQPPDAAEFFFLFTLQVLDGKEPLPKAAAAEFWSVFVGLRAEELGLQESIKQAMSMLGPLLSQSLARNFGGNASRSELDRLSEPLKKLVRYPKAKEWLQSGLNHTSFPSSLVTPDQKTLFVKKVISLRGNRTTNQVVREFWLDARGSSFAYAS